MGQTLQRGTSVVIVSYYFTPKMPCPPIIDVLHYLFSFFLVVNPVPFLTRLGQLPPDRTDAVVVAHQTETGEQQKEADAHGDSPGKGHQRLCVDVVEQNHHVASLAVLTSIEDLYGEHGLLVEWLGHVEL